jgi:DNA helicase-2/ATP-dependent DNA helicase PcrA
MVAPTWDLMSSPTIGSPAAANLFAHSGSDAMAEGAFQFIAVARLVTQQSEDGEVQHGTSSLYRFDITTSMRNPREVSPPVPNLPIVTAPGPAALGRSVVVPPDDAIPAPWLTAPVVVVDDTGIADEEALAGLVERLHRAWAEREAIVIELALDDAELRAPETESRPPFELGAAFTFLRERLHFLVWANSYDARLDPPRWWWGVKAESAGARAGGAADVLLPDGTAAWIDGGPRGPLDGVAEPIVSAETVSWGSLAPVPPRVDRAGDLAADQAEAVAHGSGAARIIAPAGSGKTRTLIARLRHLIDDRGYEPGAVCALAYNTKAAAEMRERLGTASGVRVRTIHSLGWEILREARGNLELLGEREMRAILDRLVQTPPRPNTDTIGPYLEALGETRIALRPPDEVEASRDDVPDFAVVYERYRERLRRGGAADFDEQVFGAIEALLADPELRRRWQARCRHLLVDEFQDLTAAYLLLIRLVASPELDVFGVGDDDQTIYGYAGADPAFLIDYGTLFPGAASHALEVNYRCPAPVVTAASNLLGYNQQRIDKTIIAGPRAAADPGAFAVERRPGSEMAVDAADRIVSWLEETDPTDVAVLSRVNSALLPVHLALADRGVPFDSPLGPDLLRRTVLSSALAWMRLGLDPDAMARNDVLSAVRRPSRGLNRLANDLLQRRSRFDLAAVLDAGRELDGQRAAKWDSFVEDLEQVAVAAEDDDAAGLLDVVISRVGLESSAHALDRGRSRADRAGQSDDLVALRRAAAIHPSLGDFELWLSDTLARSSRPDGVLLSTVHRAKGLEWDRVIVFGADQGLLPHTLAGDWEEERRIFHVAITRARQQAVVLADRDHPSLFLDELTGKAKAAPTKREIERPKRGKRQRATPGVSATPGDRVRVPGGYAGTVDEVDGNGVWVEVAGGALLQVRWGEEITTPAGKGPLTPPSEGLEPDADLVERLKTWRREVSQAKGVPAYVIFNDSTLEIIAATRPESEEALVAVPGIGPARLEAYGDAIIEICSG